MPMLTTRSKSDTATSKPPRYGWPLKPGNTYAAFLSHYKVQGGMEARFLHDTLEKMLHVPKKPHEHVSAVVLSECQ